MTYSSSCNVCYLESVSEKRIMTNGASPDLLPSGPHSVMPPVANNEALYAGAWESSTRHCTIPALDDESL